MFFLAIEHQLHRRVGVLREPGADQPLAADAQRFAAETAAHVLTDHANVGLRDLQPGGEVLPRLVDALRGNPHRQLVAVPLTDRAVRLHARMRDHLRLVGLFDGVRGCLEPCRDIARLLRLTLTHVAAGEDLRCLRVERPLDQRDVRQHFVLDANQPGGIDRALFGVGGDGGDFVALKHHPVASRIVRIAPHERGANTRGAFCRRQINRHDARMRMR